MKKKSTYSGINDDFISIGWQMLLSLYDKLPPILKANCPTTSVTVTVDSVCMCAIVTFLVSIVLDF